MLNGKVAVVTGGSMGIGEAIARVFLAEGASVVLASRDLTRVESAQARLGQPDRTLAIACDVRQREQVDRLARAALDRFGRIDLWVNNAGHGLLDSVAAMDIDACKSMFDTNLFGAIHGLQAAASVMKSQRSGTIINISSVAGHIAVPYMGAYCATKFAMNALGRAARMELKNSGVRVMTVCPGYIDTEFGMNAVKGKESQRVGGRIRRGITAERVARAVLRGYVKNKREIVVPWHNWIAVKLYEHFPKFIEWVMTRSLKPSDQILAETAARKNRSAAG